MDPNIILYKLQKYQNKLESGTGEKSIYDAKIEYYQKYLLEGGVVPSLNPNNPNNPNLGRRNQQPKIHKEPAHYPIIHPLKYNECININSYPTMPKDKNLVHLFDMINKKISENKDFSDAELIPLNAILEKLYPNFNMNLLVDLDKNIKDIKECLSKNIFISEQLLYGRIFRILNGIIHRVKYDYANQQYSLKNPSPLNILMAEARRTYE
jgi:hypothetical protein